MAAIEVRIREERILRERWGMVTYLADKMKDRVAWGVDVEDLQSGASLGLLQSVRRHDPSRGRITTYATPRMFGAMRDELRETDWVPRLARARKEHVPLMHSTSQGAAYDERGQLENTEAVDHRTLPVDVAAARDFWRRVGEIVSPTEARVLELYYRRDLTLKEIGRQLELSESRVCQLHARALQRARRRLGQGAIA